MQNQMAPRASNEMPCSLSIFVAWSVSFVLKWTKYHWIKLFLLQFLIWWTHRAIYKWSLNENCPPHLWIDPVWADRLRRKWQRRRPRPAKGISGVKFQETCSATFVAENTTQKLARIEDCNASFLHLLTYQLGWLATIGNWHTPSMFYLGLVYKGQLLCLCRILGAFY